MTSQIQQATSEQSTGIHQALDVTHAAIRLIDQNLESSRQISLMTEDLSSQASPLLQSVERFKVSSWKEEG